jgi:hypothetical protein
MQLLINPDPTSHGLPTPLAKGSSGACSGGGHSKFKQPSYRHLPAGAWEEFSLLGNIQDGSDPIWPFPHPLFPGDRQGHSVSDGKSPVK